VGVAELEGPWTKLRVLESLLVEPVAVFPIQFPEDRAGLQVSHDAVERAIHGVREDHLVPGLAGVPHGKPEERVETLGEPDVLGIYLD